MLGVMLTVDRIAFLKRRADLGHPLFDQGQSATIVAADYWTARNGWRHLLRLVKVVNGKEVEEVRQHPATDKERLATCEEKRKYRADHIDKIRRADRLRKRCRREKLRAEKASHSAGRIVNCGTCRPR
jgi:hypothetical protein